MKHTEARLIEVTQDLGLCTFTKLTSDSDTKQFENHCPVALTSALPFSCSSGWANEASQIHVSFSYPVFELKQ